MPLLMARYCREILELMPNRLETFFKISLSMNYFSPKKGRWRGGADLPMIDSEGKMYLDKKDQKIRPGKFYYNLFANPSLFY